MAKKSKQKPYAHLRLKPKRFQNLVKKEIWEMFKIPIQDNVHRANSQIERHCQLFIDFIFTELTISELAIKRNYTTSQVTYSIHYGARLLGNSTINKLNMPLIKLLLDLDIKES